MSNESHNLRAQLENLPGQIERFYDVYFSELRKGLSRSDLFSEAVPGFLKGYKRVLALGGRDGVVVAHFPVGLGFTVSGKDSGKVLLRFSSEPRANEDVYEFAAPFDLPVRDLAEAISGEEDIGLEISAGVPWGVIGFAAPQQKVDVTTGRLVWEAPWTRLTCADFNSLHFWRDPGQARREAHEDLEPYVRWSEALSHAPAYEELDEVEAPEAIEEAGVEAGDPGVVVEVLERPRPALLVEYADPEGRTKALITYSADLGRILDVLPTRDRGSVSRRAARGPEPVLTAQVYAAPSAA
jgi:hypothetical protein